MSENAERVRFDRGKSVAAPHLVVETNMKPLRKITGYAVNEYGITVEVLECGHTQLIKKDMYGSETNAIRRRCHKCKVDGKAI